MRISTTRRDLLLTAGAALSAVATAQAQEPVLAADSFQTPVVVDTHIHLWDTNRPGGVSWPPQSDTLLYRPVLPAEYKALVRRLGVSGAVVIEASPLLEDNQWILDLVSDDPMFVAYIGHLEPGTDTFRPNLERFAKYPLFRGIRVTGDALVKGITRQAFINDLLLLSEANLMMDVLGNETMLNPLITIAQKLPLLRIAIDHMPEEPAGWKADTLRTLARHPRMYCKISGVLKNVAGKVPDDPAFYKSALDELWSIFGSRRVMYGSNWPVSERLALYSTVFAVVKNYVAQRPALDAENFFSMNARACYQWA
jgi:predicted TIM-barrel fold metal-dependent hydrolase